MANDKPKGKHGGPRPKVREDDGRTFNVRTEAGTTAPYEVNDLDRMFITQFAAVMNIDHIAAKLGISKNTIYRHYRKELAQAIAETEAKIGQKLLDQALKEDCRTSQIFWLKHKAKWSQRVELAGSDGGAIQHFDLSRLTDEQLDALGPVIDQLLASAPVIGSTQESEGSEGQ